MERRTGPCRGCRKSIPWVDEYCLKCEQAQAAEEELEEERREMVEGILVMATREGWVECDQNGVLCGIHAVPGAKPIDISGYDERIADPEEKNFYLECENRDCDCLREWDLPVRPEPDDDAGDY